MLLYHLPQHHHTPIYFEERCFEALESVEALESDEFLYDNPKLTLDQIAKYKKYVLPIDETILKVYNNYVNGQCRNRTSFLKVMKMLREVRKHAIKVCGMK